MVHLIVHLVSEIRECGPVHLRWMYPFERYMKILKGYVKNPYRPEASIVERYVAEEAIEFCSQYLSEKKSIGHSKTRYEGRILGKGTLGGKLKNANREEVLQAHLNILNNNPEIDTYLEAHKAIIKEQNPRKNEKWILNAHNKTFCSWLKENVSNDASVLVRRLASGPNFDVLCWQGYDINGYSFYTKEQDDKSTMQNSGVTLEAECMHFSSSKDKNPRLATSSYFGIIEEIWEIDYITFKVPVFKCKWAGNNGVKVDELGVRLVDFSKLGSKNDQFIMASQAKQVFYVTDPSNKNLSVVCNGKRIISSDDQDDLTLDMNEMPAHSLPLPGIDSEHETDDVLVVRVDHCEGIWENNPTN
ncbi:hypothetical protein CASFOL_007631 [Castilleja foliolosa]|uniref:DUF4218 domain-containing protein n=1 Tax=Castilleja foliolosa TaxID=1961234 RepID=A0ABD3E1L3_9LAMI